MSDNSPHLFGWDLLYGSVEKDIRNDHDVLVCFVHLVLISNGFNCIGIGDSKTLDGTESKSETLPHGWNDAYAIRYIYQGRLYNLKGTYLEDGVIINLIRLDERTVSMIQLNTQNVARRSGPLNGMIPQNVAIADVVRKQLIEKIAASTKTKESANQTESQQSTQRGSTAEYSPLRSHEPPRSTVYPFLTDVNPLNIGSTDLNPFAFNPLAVPPNPGFQGGSGGMLFVPPANNPDAQFGLPRGSFPPGARFDPYRPPPENERMPRRPPNSPDNDEMPPPGFDDMFM